MYAAERKQPVKHFEFSRSCRSEFDPLVKASAAAARMENEHSSLFLSQRLRVLATSNDDAHLKSSCHMGNVYK